jgi:ubiquinone/menaquinone biosynthesis C-methylase UbiE
LEAIRKLQEHIVDPVLIVGAGQGLLVEELKKIGYTVDGIDNNPRMIEFAENRRGIKLIQADATNLSFDDNVYKTTLIATGVVDYMDDEQLIEKMLKESVRVTTSEGNVLVAFYKVHPASESIQRRIGIITNDNTFRHKYAFSLLQLQPKDMLRTIRKEADIGLLPLLFGLIKMQLLSPKKEKESSKKIAEMVNNIDDPAAFIESCPDSIPYRTSTAIHALLRKLGYSINNEYVFEKCTVVQINRFQS